MLIYRARTDYDNLEIKKLSDRKFWLEEPDFNEPQSGKRYEVFRKGHAYCVYSIDLITESTFIICIPHDHEVYKYRIDSWDLHKHFILDRDLTAQFNASTF